MESINQKQDGVNLVVPQPVYERLRANLDSVKASLYAVREDVVIGDRPAAYDLARAMKIVECMLVDFSLIEVEPAVPAAFGNLRRYRWQCRENGRRQGPVLLVDYTFNVDDGASIKRIITEQPRPDLSGQTDDSLSPLDDSTVEAIREEIEAAERKATDEDFEGYLADRRYDDRIDRILEDALDAATHREALNG